MIFSMVEMMQGTALPNRSSRYTQRRGMTIVLHGFEGENPEIGRTLPIRPFWMAILGGFITMEAYKTFTMAKNRM